MMLKLLSFGWTWTILILILVVSVLVFMFNSKFLIDNFEDLDLSCDVVQNKHYHSEELLHKSRCPNLVIVEKNIGGRPIFFVEQGDQNGPFFSKDHVRYYYMGVSPDGNVLDLDYDLYYYPWYNPYRWFRGPYGYYPRRRRTHWRKDLYDKWGDYSRRLDRRNNRNKRPAIHKQMTKSKSPNRSVSSNRNKSTLYGASARL